MSKGKFVAFALIAASLLSWQIAGVNNATSGTSGIVDPCSSLVWMTGTTPVCMMNCPLDDGRDLDTDLGVVIYVQARDGSAVPTSGIAGIPTQDIWMEGCSGTVVLCGGGGSIDADSATNAFGYTTITGDWSASGCDLTGIVVVIQGVPVSDATTCLPIFSKYGTLHNGHTQLPPVYDACWDFNCDGLIELLDFSTFGQHWTHDCQGP